MPGARDTSGGRRHHASHGRCCAGSADVPVSFHQAIPVGLRCHAAPVQDREQARACEDPARRRTAVGHRGVHGGRLLEPRELQHAVRQARGREPLGLSATHARDGVRTGQSAVSSLPRMSHLDDAPPARRVQQLSRSVASARLADWAHADHTHEHHGRRPGQGAAVLYRRPRFPEEARHPRRRVPLSAWISEDSKAVAGMPCANSAS